MPAKNAIASLIKNMSKITTTSDSPLPRTLLDSLHFEYSRGGIVRLRTPYCEQEHIYPFDHISLVKSGKFAFTTSAGPGAISARAVSFIPAGIPHQAKTMTSGTAEIAWLRFRFTVLGGVNLLALFRIPRDIPLCRTRPAIRPIILELAALAIQPRCPASGAWQAAARRQALGFSLLQGLLSAAQAQPAMRHFLLHTERLEPVFAHIGENLAQPLELGALAHRANLSVSRFVQVFKAVTGAPPLQYVKHLRLQRALEVLAATDQPIAALGASLGYPDQFHFCRLFKARFGISPRAYRQAQKNVVF